jgi:hypothetical protein
VATSIISISDPGVHFGDNMAARALARECNEAGARVVRDYPGRFGLFAVLPLPDVDGSMKELEYALDTLKADGIGVLSSYEGKYLGNPLYTPLLEEMNRRRGVIYCHPFCAACGVSPTLTEAQNRGVEFVFDTTRTILSLLQTGRRRQISGHQIHLVARRRDRALHHQPIEWCRRRQAAEGSHLRTAEDVLRHGAGVQSVHHAVVPQVHPRLADCVRHRLPARWRIGGDCREGVEG